MSDEREESEFDWQDWDEVDGGTIVRPVQALAIYFNTSDNVVIRQAGDSGHIQDDNIIAIPMDQAKLLAKRLAAFCRANSKSKKSS